MLKKQGVASVLDVADFVQLLRDAVYEEEDCERAHAASDRLEEFLKQSGPEIRDLLAVEMFESFQNTEYPCSSDIGRLGPETKRLFAEIQAIWKTSVELDLQDRTVLEGEILISHIVRQLSFEHSDLSRLQS